MIPLSRRRFLQGTALSLTSQMLGCKLAQTPAPIAGAIVGASAAAGHLIRGENFSRPSRTIEVDTLIVGGGVAGLSAGWWLHRQGAGNYQILELSDEVGGNSVSGENATSPYPWGAHYVPIPNRESLYVHTLFEELGVIEKNSQDGVPVFNELYLCAAPQERLFKDGRWQEGVIPSIRATAEDQAEYRRFFELMETFRSAKGADGKRAFAIPMELSSVDTQYTNLDAISFELFLQKNSFNSEPLLWYLNYCCRDDYGSEFSQISAWSGVHYFAARNGWASNAGAQEILTWPDGNGWIVKGLRNRNEGKITTNAVAFDIRESDDRVLTRYIDTSTEEVTEVRSKALIFCAPRFTAPFIIDSIRQNRPAYLADFEYAPWMVANISLTEPPDGAGSEMAWDNVLYGSNSLGYVVATHQRLNVSEKTVLTYYLPLSSADSVAARRSAMSQSYEEWCSLILTDLSKPHPQIRKYIERIDIWLWGHGMIIPKPGFIHGESRRLAKVQKPPVFFAHSDMSGFSIFEEAQYRGVNAAEGVIAYLKDTRSGNA